MALSAANAINQLSKVREFGDKLVASARSGFAEVKTMEQAAEEGDTVAQAAVEEKKTEAKKSLVRTGLLDILMGALMAYIAFRYNQNERRGWLKILTVVAAFFFWPLYALYILIRSGALGKTESITGLSDVTGTFQDVQASLKGTMGHLKSTATEDIKRFKGGYYY